MSGGATATATSSPPPPPPSPSYSFISGGDFTPTEQRPESNEPYPQASVLAAVILTCFAPFISLIAAMVFLQEQRSEVRRSQLKSWAIASAAWLVVGGVFFFAVISSFAGSGDPGPYPPGSFPGG